MHALIGDVAADQRPSLPRQGLVEGGAERAYCRDGGDPEGDAQHEDEKAAGPGAKLAQRNRQRERQPDARAARP